jgi:nudix-type nucleoside diphosphatase (YffH/AdpP family)
METPNGPGRVVFAGRVLSVRVDPIWAKSGPTTREVVQRPPAVVIVAEDPLQRLVVIRQFRWAVRDWLVELPEGLIDPGEEPLNAAQRELAEETGFTAKTWVPLFRVYPSPGFSDEIIHFFFANNLRAGRAHGDADEEITVDFWSRSQAVQAIGADGIHNGLFVTGILWWLSQLS